MSFISDTDEVRRLARNVVVEDFDDTQIESYQVKEYSLIRTLTDKDDWDSADREFGALQLIETSLAAADVIRHYGNPEDPSVVNAWQAMRQSTLMDLDKIVDNLDTEADTAETEVDIGRTDFKGWTKAGTEPPNRLNSSMIVDTESS